MEKIANTQELTAELERVLAYCKTPNPSRERVASALRGLANRVAVADMLTPQQFESKLKAAIRQGQKLLAATSDYSDLQTARLKAVRGLNRLDELVRFIEGVAEAKNWDTYFDKVKAAKTQLNEFAEAHLETIHKSQDAELQRLKSDKSEEDPALAQYKKELQLMRSR